MSFRKLLEKLLYQLIVVAGPAIIEMIIKIIKGLSDDEVKEVAKKTAEAIKNGD